MRAGGDDAHGRRLRGLIVIMWRAGLRIQEALPRAESDLDQRRGALLVRRGKGGRRREVGMDAWGWEELQPWLELRLQMPVGPLFCVINRPDAGPALVKCPRGDLSRERQALPIASRRPCHGCRNTTGVRPRGRGRPRLVSCECTADRRARDCFCLTRKVSRCCARGVS